MSEDEKKLVRIRDEVQSELDKLSEKTKNTVLHRDVMTSVLHIERLIRLCTCEVFVDRRKNYEAIKKS